ncbi:MAG: 3-deoxy-manno-octulosonate cytidylyltransferase [Bacteroidetes bacterium]|jgi:3-deoxy-manno-octulosonate cytidylyltransferase (CMP-KDO synthetase)|nr:3-deoxy-manno-octulosonate cytidylyltransferase [Bacteroidota bacterium]
MKVLGVIPARYASTRYPGKPLALIAGKSMIHRVYDQAKLAGSLTKVIVATDDKRIYDAVISFGGEVVMTDAGHPSGTDRCAETLLACGEKFDAVINIQGDEPFIHPGQIDLVSGLLREGGAEIATLVKKIQSHAELFNVNSPKVVLSANGDALYFSRQVIPYLKGVSESDWHNRHTYFKHIGIYGYAAAILPKLAELKHGKLEMAESLEQLRWLENGFKIKTAVTEFETIAVDSPDDLVKAEEFATQL